MPLRDLECRRCKHVAEYFFWASLGPPEQCDCGGDLIMLPLAAQPNDVRNGKVFPFITTHITADGSPIEVTDINHVRRLERDYGVVLTAFSNNHAMDSIPDAPVYRGRNRRT